MSQSERYSQRGVSADKTDVHNAIKGTDKGLFPNAFCKILPDYSGGDKMYCNIMHADTAGTKTSLAYIYWKETGDNSVWKGIIQDALVMNLDDLICVGCTDNIIVSSTIGRNKNVITGEVLSHLINGTISLLDELKELGISIHLSGGETADVGDIVRTLDVGFTAFARVKRSDVIDIRIQSGDVIVGLASFGKANYEKEYNGGIGSNGLTSAKHDVFSKVYSEKYPESFDPAVPHNLIYSGKRLLTEKEPETGIHIGKLILSPTRTYSPVIKKIVEQHRSNIHGIIHCSGGAQTKVMKFSPLQLPSERVRWDSSESPSDQRGREGDMSIHIIKDHLFKTPPLFRLIQRESGTDWKEMYKVFNMGHRMELYIPAEIAGEIITISKSFGIDAQIIGRVEKSDKLQLTIRSEYGEFFYS